MNRFPVYTPNLAAPEHVRLELAPIDPKSTAQARHTLQVQSGLERTEAI